MEQTFRSSMNWLHTWAGVVLGGVLFAIFWMGTLSVFDREIDRWMAPMTRLTPPQGATSVELLRSSLQEAVAAGAPTSSVIMPTERQPTARVTWRYPSGVVEHLHYDPATGVALADPGTLGGTRFLYPFHYMLHLRLRNLGYWIVGLAAMAMLVLCVSGVVIHKKILTDFFTFRFDRKPLRLLLDLHNLTGVLGLPFHFVITLSGLIIFWSIYMPGAWQMAYPDRQTLNAESATFNRAKANRPGEVGSIDAMVEQARILWGGDTPRAVFVRHLGDAAAYVQLNRPNEDRVTAVFDAAYFDAVTGKLLHQRTGRRPVMAAQQFISGLHLIEFRHWPLRWLYFVLGLSGCVMIATGHLFWLESRRKNHAQLSLRGVPVVGA